MFTSGTCAERSTNHFPSNSSKRCVGWAIVCARRSRIDTLHLNESSFTRLSVGCLVHAAIECDICTRRHGYILRPATLPVVEFARFRKPPLDTGRANTAPGTC